jgi:hypothetical protein
MFDNNEVLQKPNPFLYVSGLTKLYRHVQINQRLKNASDLMHVNFLL